MKHFMLYVFLVLMFFISACSTMQQTSVCDTKEKSYLCEIAEKEGVTLEYIGDALVLANVAAIEKGVHTPEEAVAVLKSLRKLVDNPISYIFFKDQIVKNKGILAVSDRFLGYLYRTQIMTVKDRTIIQNFLDEQIEVWE